MAAVASFQASPGHPGQEAVLIACAYLDTPLKIEAPDADLKVRSGIVLDLCFDNPRNCAWFGWGRPLPQVAIPFVAEELLQGCTHQNTLWCVQFGVVLPVSSGVWVSI